MIVGVDFPFVQMRTLDVLAVLPSLGKVNALVFLALGAFASDPVAPSQRDICTYTQLSRPSVSTGLAFLCKEELAHCIVDEEGVRRYRADEKFFRYNGRAPVSVREVVPVSGRSKRIAAGDVKAVFTSALEESRVQNNVSGHNPTTALEAALGILQEAGIFTAQEDFANAGVTVEQAEAIADFIRNAPKKIGNAPAYARRCLLANPQWAPTIFNQRSLWWSEGYDEAISR